MTKMKKLINADILKTELNKLVDKYVENETIDTEINNILYKYIPELIDKLAEEVNEDGNILDTEYKDPIVNKIKELDFGEEFEMKVHSVWSKYKIVQSELSEEEIDIIVIGEPNACYAMGYSNMKDLKQCLIKDYWDGIITNIRTED